MGRLALSHLTFTGTNVAPASVDFSPRVTVIHGPSDTGKSFIVDAIDFVLGAKDPLAEAVARGRAFLDAGAPVVFVPAVLDEEQVTTLVEAFGPQRLTTIGVPGSRPAQA